MRMGTGHKSISAFNLMNQSVGEQKIKGAVNRDRCRAGAVLCHAFDNVIGADGGMALGHRTQDFTALAREFAAAPLAGALGPSDQVGSAMGVVMVGVKKGHTVII